jgi:hypothetical protein
MPSRRAPSSDYLREQLAQEAARLIVDHGMHDYGQAKRKAASRLGVREASALPSNTEIECSVIERQRIFDPDIHERRLMVLLQLAIEIMDVMADFQPRLVGAALAGTVTENSPLELHAFTDSPEAVLVELEAQGYSLRDCQRRYRFRAHSTSLIPGYSFVTGGERVYVLTFPEKGVRQAPLSPVDRRPMRRAARHRVLALLNSQAS